MYLNPPSPRPEELFGNPPLNFSERFRRCGDVRPSDSCKARSRDLRNLIASDVHEIRRKKWE